MKLKQEQELEIFITECGTLRITQYNPIYDDEVSIILSPYQFLKIADWFKSFEKPIFNAWNEGIDNEDEENG